LAIDPSDSVALYNKGVALSSLGNHTQATAYFDKTLAINPNDRDTLMAKEEAQSLLQK
jgi:tetratricopeptide (TPR) repeat protein